MLHVHYLPGLKPGDIDPVLLGLRHSMHKLPPLETPSGSVNPMFQKPALPPSQPIGLTSFHMKGIDSEAPEVSPLTH